MTIMTQEQKPFTNPIKGFTTNYQAEILKPYVLACDYYEGNRTYRGFDTYQDYEKYITKIHGFKHHVFYEILNKNITRLFFDIDKKQGTNKPDFDAFLNLLVTQFNNVFDDQINLNKLLIYNRQEVDSDVIKSSHIIIPNYKCSKALMSLFIKYLKQVTDNEIVKSLDDKIYTKNRLFNLPYNTKLTNIYRDKENPREFVDYTKQDSTPKNYLASYTEGTPDLKINRFKLLALASHILSKERDRLNTKVAFNKLKAVSKNENNGDECVAKPKSINIKSPIDMVDYLISNLPEAFYYNSPDWKIITCILKKYNMPSASSTVWLKTSSIKTNNRWSEQTNTAYYNSIDKAKTKSGMPLFKQIIEKYLSISIDYNFDDKLINWINKKLIGDYTDIITNTKGTNNITLGNGYSYDNKSGFLTRHKKTITGNFYIEEELKNIASNEKIDCLIELENIYDIEPYLIDFNTSNCGVFAVKAKWGSGKTFIIIRNIINDAKRKNQRVIMLTENNALNKKLTQDFQFISHIDNTYIDQNENIACSTESIQKVDFRADDILILDEYESIIAHYESDTFKLQAFDKFMKLKHALQTVNKIVVLDADLSNDRLNLLKTITNKSFATYYVKTNNFNDYDFNLYLKETNFLNHFYNECGNKRVLMASSSKNFNNEVFDEVKALHKNKTILKIDGDGVKLWKSVQMDKSLRKDDVLDNLENVIIKNNVDVFLYSPSIKTGISINKTYFDKCFAYGHSRSVCSREFIQMLFRARNLKDKEINICLNTGITKPKIPVSQSQVKRSILDPIISFQTLKSFEANYRIEGDDDYYLIKLDADYLQLKIINTQEAYNSSSRYTQDFLMRMLYNHGIKINYINEDVNCKLERETFDNDIEPDEFVNTDMITREEHYANEMYNNDVDWRVTQKHRLFYKCYFIKGITDKNEYDETVYDAINKTDYYKIYNSNDTKRKYTYLKHFLNKTAEDVKQNHSQYISEMSNSDNHFNKTEANANRQILLMKIIKSLNINLLEMPVKISNKDFKKAIDGELVDTLKAYYDIHLIENNKSHLLDNTSDKFIKNMKEIVTEFLNDIGVNIKYESKANHTTRDGDKMIIYYSHFQTTKTKRYEGRLNPEIHFRVKPDEVRKFRKGFKYNEFPAYKCFNKDYYTTYEIVMNKHLTKFRENKTTEIEHKIMLDKLNLDIKTFYLNKYKPIVMTDEEYKTNDNLFLE